MTKSISIICIWSIFFFALMAQPLSAQLETPTNLNVVVVDENDATLTWDAPIIGDDPILLHWDSGLNEDSWGFFLSGEQFDVAAKWDPVHIASYDGWQITKLSFYVVSDAPTLVLKLWSGPDATEIYSQDITSFNVNAWTYITLDTPVTIDASTQLWAGLNIDMPYAQAVMGLDGGPAIDEYGNLYKYNGTWYSDLAKNNNIQIEIEEVVTRDIQAELLGYNVYRDNDQINATTVLSTSYLDENLLNGIYEYYVTALYDEGESDPSNTVQVIIDQPGILESDSLALVDLYNSCDGANWNYNENWLTGPVNEWWGITTTGVRVTKLGLGNIGVSGDLPESLGDLTALDDLYLSSNNITSMPSSIGNLTLLTKLWIGMNPLTNIPNSFGNLVNLEELHLGFTNLGTLPESFGNLESLRWLALGDAGLNSLPSSFGNLTAVESCFLWGNNLTELPIYIGGMTNLRYLNVNDNLLTTLPESIGDLQNLGWLYVEENQLISLPESFGNLSSLDTLKLSVNQLTSLPESFGNLSDLNYVSLSLNNLTELPASISDLETIEEIYVDQNQLQSLPDDIGNLTTLRALTISSNNVTILPESMSDLVLLYSFFANNNQIENIPVNIGNMTGLHYLALDGNNIEVVPESIGGLTALGYIGLTENNIEFLPQSFGDLPADTVLLTNNNIKFLPESMFYNTYKYLWIDDNELQFGSIEPFVGNVFSEYLYEPQEDFGVDTTVYLATQGVVDFTWEVSGDYNVYQWYKDGEIVDGQTSNTLLIIDVSMDDNGIYKLKVTNTIANQLTLWSKNVIVDAVITDVNEKFENEITVYPNPVTGNYINISTTNAEQLYNVQIINISGSIVIETSIRNSVNQLDISNLSRGLYFIKLTDTQNNQNTIKFSRN